ncbi:MAG: hypothetical protein JWL89_119 [Candidatus Saccharibacteria bacterium]|nr:hypothetical protein [Candidatus Saccharibacteria bacterium]
MLAAIAVRGGTAMALALPCVAAVGLMILRAHGQQRSIDHG